MSTVSICPSCGRRFWKTCPLCGDPAVAGGGQAREMTGAERADWVREQVRLEDVVRDYTWLARGGGSGLTGPCPFCAGGSVGVSAPRQWYGCPSCGAGGDVIEFVMRAEGLPREAAVDRLRRRNGLFAPRL